jgi:hypothetical protein
MSPRKLKIIHGHLSDLSFLTKRAFKRLKVINTESTAPVIIVVTYSSSLMVFTFQVKKWKISVSNIFLWLISSSLKGKLKILDFMSFMEMALNQCLLYVHMFPLSLTRLLLCFGLRHDDALIERVIEPVLSRLTYFRYLWLKKPS